MRILVTGAAGFLGRAIIASGADQGLFMIAASRNGARVPGAADILATGDLADGNGAIDFAKTTLAGVDAVINCAARVHVLKREDPVQAEAAYTAMNARLPVSLAKAAREAEVRHFVQISSVAAIASASAAGETITDASAPAPTTPYGKAKLEADIALASLVTPDFAITSLRPPALYGPGVGAWFAMLARAAKAGMPLPVAAISNRRSFAYAGNIADAALATLRLNQSGAFIVTDSPPISTAQLYRQLLAQYQKPGRVWNWPEPLIRIPARLVLGARADSLLGNATFDGARFAKEFSWTPPVGQAEALRRTIQQR